MGPDISGGFPPFFELPHPVFTSTSDRLEGAVWVDFFLLPLRGVTRAGATPGETAKHKDSSNPLWENLPESKGLG